MSIIIICHKTPCIGRKRALQVEYMKIEYILEVLGAENLFPYMKIKYINIIQCTMLLKTACSFRICYNNFIVTVHIY